MRRAEHRARGAGARRRILPAEVLRDSAYWFAVGGLISLVGSSIQFAWGDGRKPRRGAVDDGASDAGSGGPVRSWHRHLTSRFSVARVVGAAAAVLVMVLFLKLFETVKTAFPIVRRFSWDEALYHVDRALAPGHDPWRLLQPYLGHPAATRILDDGYALWYVVVMGTLPWQFWTPRREIRARFVLAFVLCWAVIGSVLAILLSPAGPAYYGRVVG